MTRTRSLIALTVGLALAPLPTVVSSIAAAATPPAITEQDVKGVWAIRQGQAFSESVYGLDIAGYTIRLHWKDVEPQRGVYNWSLFDSVLARAKQGGKLVRPWVMFGVGVPSWVGAQTFTGSADSPCDSAGATIPVPWDANLRREQLAFIHTFAERYRDDPAVAFFPLAGPSAKWAELCLPNNTTQQPGYSNQVILDVWKEIIDTWISVRGNKRLSFSASAAPSFYTALGTDIANYGISRLGREFSPQWNFLDTKYANAVRTIGTQWAPKTVIGWQMWGAAAWCPNGRCAVDYEGSIRLAKDNGSTFIEVYDDDLRVASRGAIAEQITAEMRGTPATTTTTTTAPPPTTTTTTTAPPPTTTTTWADTTPPDTSVTGVSGGLKKVTCSGSASDNRGVSRVRVAIRNQATGKWRRAGGTWGDFQSHLATLASPGARSTSWSFSWVPPSTGTYGIHAVAWDAAGNDDPSPTWRTITVTSNRASFG